MTNKVKPFFIRITDDMTPQMVQDAFDKCVGAGAAASEGVDGASQKFNYQGLYNFSWEFFGVDDKNETYLTDDSDGFGRYAQEITLDQLDEWLGLSDVEWKNGDECVISRKGLSGEVLSDSGTYYAETDTHYWLHGIGCRDKKDVSGNIYSKEKYWLSKPETPEQKAEREKKEEAAEMIQCILDNYTLCEESAIDYVIDYLKECESLGK